MNIRFAPALMLPVLGMLVAASVAFAQQPNATPQPIPNASPVNVIFILVDDHRYDAMGFLGHPFLETPHMDALAKGGVYLPNAFVTTSLCSPSRASILTGQYVHNHRVVDNNNLTPKGTIFFPQYLQKAGYDTAFFGKWHMGGASDDPRPGFDRWVSFKGQGLYYPRNNWTWNVDGQRVPQKGYVTDELADYAIEWLDGRKGAKGGKPFFAYLSHKAVHGMFEPAQRHKGKYKDAKWTPPDTMANTEANYRHKPRWVRDQRNSWHGVDYAYHNAKTPVEQLYKDYCETLLAVDESVGRVMTWLKDNGHYDDTLVIFMGDNGFLWGEHGLIDKRNAYEESMRVPLLAHCPKLLKPGTKVEGVVANIDIGPTIMEAMGLQTPDHMDGRSWLKLATGETKLADWRDYLLYEYYWEYNYPHTPTVFALRGNDYKFIQYHGVWDIDELYDMRNDPHEKNNLIFSEEHQRLIRDLRARLFRALEETNGDRIPLAPKRGHGASLRHEGGSQPAGFPDEWIRE